MNDTLRTPATRAQALANSGRAMTYVRLVGAAFAALQVTLTPNQPAWVAPIGYVLAGFLLMATATLHLAGLVAGQRERGLTAVAWLGIGVDLAVIIGYVFLYTWDPTSALWALLFILPLEGAIRFGLAGAMATMSTAAGLYVVREIWGSGAYRYPLLIDSITYRLGIGFIIALVAGLMARNLSREREQTKDAYLKLRELDRLKDEFLSAASHELRTPLTVISGFARTLRRYPDLPAERRADYLDAVVRHSDRLTRLANDIIDVSRLEQGQLRIEIEPMPVDEIIRRTVDISGLAVETDLEPELIALADPARVEQIVFNLLHNAAKYGRPPLRVEARKSGAGIQISVTDEGDGIRDADRNHIFDLFYRSSSSTEGSGIGLTFSRRLAEAQNGTLRYEPNMPRGARFTLELPGFAGVSIGASLT